MKCIDCGIEISRKRYSRCRKCYDIKRHEVSIKKKIELNCLYCQKKFFRSFLRLKDSKHKKYFCSRKCKDLGQRIKFGIKEIHPSHYKDGAGNYRRDAFEHYGKVCENCGYNKYEEVLDVHHIDSDHKNFKFSNLIVLCANCHRLLTLKRGYIENRKIKIYD